MQISNSTDHHDDPSSWLNSDRAVGYLPDWVGSGNFAHVISMMASAGCCGVQVLDASGTVRYACGDIFDPALGPERGVGSRLESIYRPEVARERQEVFAQLARQRPTNALLLDMVQGRELWWMSSAAYCDDELCGLFSIGVHPHPSARPADGPDVKRLRYVISSGPLARLTLGELEVLRLLAMGRRREDMAQELRRTVKAVERRRTTLGRKLEAEHAGELAMIGVEAGLHRMSHAELTRFADANCGTNAPTSGIAVSSA